MGIDVQAVMGNARCAAAVFGQLDQEHTDRIARTVCRVGFNHRVRLAKMAVEETGIGKWEDQVMENVLATHLLWERIGPMKTVGVLGEDDAAGITEIAQPVGPVLAVIPPAGPTASTLFSILLALKTRNPVVVCAHRDAVRSSFETARLCYEAALAKDAPEHCIQWVLPDTPDALRALAGHPAVARVLSGGDVRPPGDQAPCGPPGAGTATGGVPVLVERTADIPFTADQVLLSRTFDHGAGFCSEQALVAMPEVADRLRGELAARGARFLSPDEIARLEAVVFDRERGGVRDDAVGRPAKTLAARAGIAAAGDVRLLVAPLSVTDREHPLAGAIPAPILACFEAEDFEQALNLCIGLGGRGDAARTAVIFSNDESCIRRFAALMNAGRILVNTPAAQGGTGCVYNSLDPSLALMCGIGGKCVATGDVSAGHLLNIQRIARRRPNRRLFAFDRERFLDDSVDASEVERVWRKNE